MVLALTKPLSRTVEVTHGLERSVYMGRIFSYVLIFVIVFIREKVTPQNRHPKKILEDI